MSIDKFGRFLNSNKTNSSFKRYRPKYFLTSEGDVNVNGRRIRYVGDPIDDEDCVNARYVSKIIQNNNKRLTDARKQIGSEMEDIVKRLESKISDLESRINSLTVELDTQRTINLKRHKTILK